jgi:hypothetical protein
MSLINYSEQDVGRDLARRAFNGTSWSPEKRGDGVVESYLAHMREVDEEFSAWATDGNRDELSADLEAYRAKYAGLLRAYLGSHGNVVSSFIAGPANFPVRQMEKRGRWADGHRDRWLEWSVKRLGQLRRKWDPRRRARAPISSDDPDAVARLTAKIEKAERLQETMKAANRVVRKNLADEEKVVELTTLGLSQKAAWELLAPDYMGGTGFPGYRLTNNSANIRRMKKRVEALSRAALDETEEVAVGSVRVVDNVEANRVQVFFPGKPAYEIRKRLKANGFRWAPSVGTWQRHRSDWALQLAREIAASYEGGE